MKTILFLLAAGVFTNHTQAAPPVLSPIVFLANPKIPWERGFYQKAAEKFCRSKGWHLPSAREFAEFAVSRGAQGIRETAYPGTPWESPAGTDMLVEEEVRRNEAEGYKAIYEYTGHQEGQSALTFVHFYYNHRGFRWDREHYYAFWSTTPSKPGVYWLMGGDIGNFGRDEQSMQRRPLVCVMEPSSRLGK